MSETLPSEWPQTRRAVWWGDDSCSMARFMFNPAKSELWVVVPASGHHTRWDNIDVVRHSGTRGPWCKWSSLVDKYPQKSAIRRRLAAFAEPSGALGYDSRVPSLPRIFCKASLDDVKAARPGKADEKLGFSDDVPTQKVDHSVGVYLIFLASRGVMKFGQTSDIARRMGEYKNGTNDGKVPTVLRTYTVYDVHGAEKLLKQRLDAFRIGALEFMHPSNLAVVAFDACVPQFDLLNLKLADTILRTTKRPALDTVATETTVVVAKQTPRWCVDFTFVVGMCLGICLYLMV